MACALNPGPWRRSGGRKGPSCPSWAVYAYLPPAPGTQPPRVLSCQRKPVHIALSRPTSGSPAPPGPIATRDTTHSVHQFAPP